MENDAVIAIVVIRLFIEAAARYHIDNGAWRVLFYGS
jgi:hypothetical protein